MKKCCLCKEEKPPEEFNKKDRAKDGLQEACKDCNKARSKAHYESNKQKYFDRNKRVRKQNAQEIQAIKAKTPCTDCGNKYHFAAMDFDHLSDKSFNIGSSGYKKSKRVLEIEMSKCEIVCSNCHRVRTFTRAQSSNG